MIYLYIIYNWLVVSTYPSEKYELVNGKDDIPYINIYEMGNSKFMFETTNHTYIYIYIYAYFLKLSFLVVNLESSSHAGNKKNLSSEENSIPSPKDPQKINHRSVDYYTKGRG